MFFLSFTFGGFSAVVGKTPCGDASVLGFRGGLYRVGRGGRGGRGL